MNIHIVTLFPEFFASPLSAGLMERFISGGGLDVQLIDPRTHAHDKHKCVDDRPYGGGPGMVMLPEPLCAAVGAIERPGRKIFLAPHGRPLTQQLARELAKERALTLVCGRYEGIDARAEQALGLEAVSVGDYVLNGGETAALALLESVARLLPGFMGTEASGDEESFSTGLLEYPHFTRPEIFAEMAVPAVLRSGDHGKIAQWRRQEALCRTRARRPDLLETAQLGAEDVAFLREAGGETLGRNLSLALVHYPVLDKQGKSIAVSVTNFDVHDMARTCRTYGLANYYVVTPLREQQALLATILGHWVTGPASRANPDRAEALDMVSGQESLEKSIDAVAAQTGQRPFVVATSASLEVRQKNRRKKKAMPLPVLTPQAVRNSLQDRPVLLVLGTSHGLAPEALELCDAVLRPVRCVSGYNHLPVRSACAILLDRILGDWY